jgi:translation initiation factor IF-2
MLAPEKREVITGMVEVRQVFKVRRSARSPAVWSPTVGQALVVGARAAQQRGDLTGELESLKRFKDDVKEVKQGFECGLSVKNFNDIVEGDQLEVFEITEVARTL